jgi:hypothetical protein
MPELVKRSVASPAGTSEALGTGVWSRFSKKATKLARNAAALCDWIRGSRSTE